MVYMYEASRNKSDNRNIPIKGATLTKAPP